MLIFPEYSQKWQHIKKQFKLKRVKRLERGRLIWERGAKSIYFDLVSSCTMLKADKVQKLKPQSLFIIVSES